MQTSAHPGPAPNGSEGIDPALAPVEAQIPWEPELFQDLIAEAVDYAEKKRVKDFREEAHQAKLSEQLVRQIAMDAQYVPWATAMLIRTGPRALTKVLNRFGVSAKYSDEGMCALSLIALGFQSWRLKGQLEDVIQKKQELDKQAAAAPAPAK